MTCRIGLDVRVTTELSLQLAVSSTAGTLLEESLDLEGATISPVLTHPGPHGTRSQSLLAGTGPLTITYRARVAAPRAEPDRPPRIEPLQVTPLPLHAPRFGAEELLYLRPSRYCPSDRLEGFAAAEFLRSQPTGDRPGAAAIATWIHDRIGYVLGSSNGHDTAEDTLITGQGACRDFAHLAVALSRAAGIPARYVAVYAPGLTPMDFHAAFEAWEEGTWWVHDPTRLAPRTSLVRIATGRDAADVAFLSTLSGFTDLETIEVTATVGGTLPADDHVSPVRLP